MLKYMYYSGKDNSCSTGENNYPVPSNSDFVWIFITKPDEKEITRIEKDFRVDKKYFRAFSKETRSVRYSTNPLIFVFMDYYLENNEIKNSHILFVLKENCLIVALPYPTSFHNELFERMIELFKKSKTKSLARLMYQFLMDDVEENYDVLEKIEHMIMDLEDGILRNKNNAKIEDVLKLKRRLHKMSRRFWGSAKIVYMIKKGITPVKVDEQSMRLLDDVYNTYMHQVDILSSAKEMLSDVLSIYSTAVSNDLNIIIKKLTSFTVILMVPTLIATVYGMNFQNIPELRWEFGYPATLAAMLVSIVLLYLFFHRKKWI